MDDSPAGSIISLILLFVLCLIGSAFFSGTEISLSSVNRIHMMSRAGSGKRSAQRVLYILDNFDEALSVMLIGNNIVNIGCATLSVLIATRIWGNGAVSLATAVTTVIIFLLGEMLPKCFARSCNEKFAEAVSGTLIFLMKVLKPLSLFFTAISNAVASPFKKRATADVTVTEDELIDIVENITSDDDFDDDTRKLVKSAMKFDDKTVAEVMVPFCDIVTVKTSMKTADILELIKQTSHSRLPVIDRKGQVKGILRIRKFLKAYIKTKHNIILASVMDYPYFTKPDVLIDDLLTLMSNHRRNLAIVKGEDGEPLGIITIEDILEELVGEIYDEDDIGGGENE